MPPKIGILAGSGELPRQLVEACRDAGRDAFVVALNGETAPDTVVTTPHAWVDIASVGKILQLLRDAGCEELCFAGGVARPSFSELKPDWTGLKLLPKIAAAARAGDDAIIRVLIGFFEESGFRVVGSDAIAESLIAPEGVMGRNEPDAAARGDIEHGIRVVHALGALDIGQAAVVRDGQVLAVEAAEGTDAMLARCLPFKRPRPAGVLVKLTKPEQEKRVDLPTIGPATIEHARQAGLCGVAVEAGATIILQRMSVVERADTGGLFIVGVKAGPDA